MRPPRIGLDHSPHVRERVPQAWGFYRDVFEMLAKAGISCLIGGAYGMTFHTGIRRDTKDFDIFLRRRDIDRALDTLKAIGYHTELTHPHFLGKVYSGEYFVDLIFSSGNGVSPVDDEWFQYALKGELFGLSARFCSIEEMIWSKAFILERERFDGADVAHLLRTGGERIDWSRLVTRFSRHWPILFAHLVLFDFIYPGERHRVPRQVVNELMDRLRDEPEQSKDPTLCQGTLLDLQALGMKDARLQPTGTMTADEIARWTAAIEEPR
jgi:hypothetical protein